MLKIVYFISIFKKVCSTVAKIFLKYQYLFVWKYEFNNLYILKNIWTVYFFQNFLIM